MKKASKRRILFAARMATMVGAACFAVSGISETLGQEKEKSRPVYIATEEVAETTYMPEVEETRVKNCIAVELSKYSYNVFNQHLNEISENVAGQVESDLESYGIRILNFFVSAVTIKPDDLEELKKLDNSMAQKRFEAMGNRDATVIEAEGLAKARELQGYTWQQEQQFDVSRTFAQNEGFAANPANMMAQIPLAFSMGDMMKNNMDAAVQAQPVTAAQTGTAAMQPDIAATQSQPAVQPQAQGGNITCVKCGTSLPKDAKFCFQCGEKVVIPQKIFCANCGNEMPPEANFCTKCGTRREK